MGEIYIAGVGMTPFGRQPDQSVYDMVGEAGGLAPKDARCRAADVSSACYAARCRHHMKTYGTTQRQIAAVAAKIHPHSVHDPLVQLRGGAGKRQVRHARIAIQENGGGLYGIEEAVVAVNVLAQQ